MSKSIQHLPSERMEQAVARREARTAQGGGAEPPDYDSTLLRVVRLETLAAKFTDQWACIEKDVAIMKSNYSTKADVAEAKNSIILWVVGAVFLAQLLPVFLKKFGL